MLEQADANLSIVPRMSSHPCNRLPHALITASIAALCGVLTACFPHSHEYILTQEFTGVLLEGGAPMRDVTVTVSHTRGDNGDYCISPEVAAVTDKDGAFRVPPRSEKHAFTSILNAPDTIQQMTSLCFQAQGKRKLAALVIARTDHAERYEMLCDWNSAPVEFKQKAGQSPDQRGICRRRGDIAPPVALLVR
jgi:hypothetical protein